MNQQAELLADLREIAVLAEACRQNKAAALVNAAIAEIKRLNVEKDEAVELARWEGAGNAARDQEIARLKDVIQKTINHLTIQIGCGPGPKTLQNAVKLLAQAREEFLIEREAYRSRLQRLLDAVKDVE